MSVTSARASSPRVGRPAPRVNLAWLLVAAAAMAGLLVGGTLFGGEAPGPRAATAAQPIAHDGLLLQVPRGWTRGDVASIPGFRDPLLLRYGDDGLRAAAEQLPATSPTLLPAALLTNLDAAPKPPTVVEVAGGRPAWRYRLTGDGSMTIAYAAPTTSGITTVACTGPIGASVPRACDALAGAVTVPGSRPLAPSASAAFMSRLPAVVSDLDAGRVEGVKALGAALRARAQARAAGELGHIHRTAIAALAPLTSRDDGLPRATVAALTASATAYTTLASAARNRVPGPYADAGRTVTAADANLRKTITKASAATSTAAEAPAMDRLAERPASEAPANAAAEAPAAARPAATGSKGADLTLLILALTGAIALFYAIRGTVRTPR